LVKCGEFAILGVFLYDYRQKMLFAFHSN
jgi:hypothetical protein